MSGLESQVQKHEYEISAIKKAVMDSSNSVLECTQAMRELTTQFAIYTERHDNTEKSIAAVSKITEELRKSNSENTISIATMKPTVESIRGMLWKMIGSIVASVGCASIIASTLIK